MSIKSLPNGPIGYSPFFLSNRFHLVAPMQLLDTNMVNKSESVNNL